MPQCKACELARESPKLTTCELAFLGIKLVGILQFSRTSPCRLAPGSYAGQAFASCSELELLTQ